MKLSFYSLLLLLNANLRISQFSTQIAHTSQFIDAYAYMLQKWEDLCFLLLFSFSWIFRLNYMWKFEFQMWHTFHATYHSLFSVPNSTHYKLFNGICSWTNVRPHFIVFYIFFFCDAAVSICIQSQYTCRNTFCKFRGEQNMLEVLKAIKECSEKYLKWELSTNRVLLNELSFRRSVWAWQNKFGIMDVWRFLFKVSCDIWCWKKAFFFLPLLWIAVSNSMFRISNLNAFFMLFTDG